MSEVQKLEKRPLPKLEELYNDVEMVSKLNELNRLLNCPPKQDWLREHPMAQGVKYIPIGIIEYLLTSIFVKWRVEVKATQVIANAVVVTVRLETLSPITLEWDWQEGIGAAPIQTKKGAPAADFNMVLNDAVMKAAPAAESYAIKDAAEKLGKLFGKDLNRKDVIEYSNLDNKFPTTPVNEIPEEIKEAISQADKSALAAIYTNNPDLHANKEFMQLLTARKTELNANTVQPSATN
ncbi:MAG: hypothetical protein ACTHMC_09715 [Pseudobacter sp.]|uniref:hypothetical protein n=1 Tax=Pseudobacter sp. TaxID=2045420 RepID=UPI003F7F4726